MTDQNAEWLELPFEGLMTKVLRECQTSFLGILTQTNMIGMGGSNAFPDDIERIKSAATTARDTFKNDLLPMWLRLQREPLPIKAQIDFLDMVLQTTSPALDAIEDAAKAMAASKNPFVGSAVRNMEQKHLVTLRQVVQTCIMYQDRLT
jgi:hypothetical protein